MRRPDACEPPGLGLDHRAEVVASVSALLLQVEADCGQVFVADRLGQQGAVGQNGVRFTYPVSMIDLALAGRCAGRTPAKRWVLASTISRKASRP